MPVLNVFLEIIKQTWSKVKHLNKVICTIVHACKIKNHLCQIRGLKARSVTRMFLEIQNIIKT